MKQNLPIAQWNAWVKHGVAIMQVIQNIICQKKKKK